jgi:hypothetical protein
MIIGFSHNKNSPISYRQLNFLPTNREAKKQKQTCVVARTKERKARNKANEKKANMRGCANKRDVAIVCLCCPVPFT